MMNSNTEYMLNNKYKYKYKHTHNSNFDRHDIFFNQFKDTNCY